MEIAHSVGGHRNAEIPCLPRAVCAYDNVLFLSCRVEEWHLYAVKQTHGRLLRWQNPLGEREEEGRHAFHFFF